MLESELFALLEQTANAAYTVTTDGEICSWNQAAERLFGYAASEVIGRNIDDILQARDSLGTRALAGGLEAETRRWDGTSDGIMPFDLEVTARAGERIWVSVSTIVFDNTRTGRRLFVRLTHDITQRRRKEALLSRLAQAARDVVVLADDPSDLAPVESLSDRERRVLQLFADGNNAQTIERALRVSGQTLRNHLHRINRKLRTHNRLEAVIHAQRRGLLD